MIDFNPSDISFDNIDRYNIKRSIYQFLVKKIFLFNGSLLDIGCGEMPYRKHILDKSEVQSYIGLDLIDGVVYNPDIKPDFLWDGVKMPFDNATFDCAFATEVLEHCPEPQITLKEIYRILKPNSPLVLTVPFIWPTHESPYDYYRYTPFALKYHLEKAGYENLEISCLGGWDASLAQVLGLWLKRRKMSKSNQKRLFFILKPIIEYLLRKDKILDPYSEQSLMTSIGVVAWKK